MQRGGLYDPLDRVAVHFKIEKASLKFYFCGRRVDGGDGILYAHDIAFFSNFTVVTKGRCTACHSTAAIKRAQF